MATFTLRKFGVLSLGAGALCLLFTGCGLDDGGGETCEYGGKTYQDGEIIPNDCADCVCEGGGVTCPTISCEPQGTCEYLGEMYDVGDSIPRSCGGCTCTEGGVMCTDIACAPEFCEMAWDPGPCEADEPRFWHNPETSLCEEVSYGGCEGNENNFSTLEECQNICFAGGGGTCTADGATYEDGESFPAEDGCNTCTCIEGAPACTKIACEPSLCELPFEDGSCDAAIPRFWHNPETGVCEEVTYGGCDGNENNFETLEACEAACVTGCTQGDTTYEDGESFPAGDGCNTCSCFEGDIACTLVDCNPDGETSCQVGETVYSHGETNVPDPASCNTCTCDAGELVQCTEINCPNECPEGRTLGQDCTSCGPADECLVQRTGCLLECDAAEDCEEEGGLCLDGLCRNACG